MDGGGLLAVGSGRYSFSEPETEYLLKEKETEDDEPSICTVRKASTLRKTCIQISCMVQLCVGLGIGYGLSVMFAELVIVFNAERTYASLIQSLFMGITVAGGVVFAFLIPRIGPGIAIFVGTFLAFLGLFASSFAKDITTIIICTGGLAGLGVGLCQFSSFLTVGWLFYEDPGLFLVILTMGISFGQVLFPTLFELFISEYNWAGAFILMSGLALQCLPFGLIIHLSSEYYIKGTTSTKKGKPFSLCNVAMFSDIVLWMIWINAYLMGQTGNIEPWFMVDHMIDRGFSRSDGATAVSVMGGGNIAGKALGAALKFCCKNTPTLAHWTYTFPIIAVLHAVIVNLNAFWPLTICCALYGCFIGLMWSQFAPTIFEASGLDGYPQAFAVANLAIGLGNLVGSTSGGYIKDTYGVYDINFYIGVAASVFMSFCTVVAFLIIRKRAKS